MNGFLAHPLTGEFSDGQTSVALGPLDDLSFDDWCQLGRQLCGMAKGVNWWVGDWWASGQRHYGERARAAAEGIFEKEFGSLVNLATVCRSFEGPRRRGHLSFTHHAEVSSLPAEDADVLLDQAEAESLSTRALRALVNQRKNRVGEDPSYQTGKTDDLYKLIVQGAKFGTVYADPPWLYDNQGTRAATRNHYRGMTVAELCELPVRNLVADDAHLHLWTTNAFLFDCPRIFDAWGFEFRSSFIWAKQQMGIGNYWRNSHEILLTAIRGNAKRFNDHSLMSWMVSDRGEHSGKPEQVRHMLERTSPGPRLEMFARRDAEGWTVWGNEVRTDLLSHTYDVKDLAA